MTCYNLVIRKSRLIIATVAMKSFFRLALLISAGCIAAVQSPLVSADPGGDGVAVGSLAISLQIQQQCQIKSDAGDSTGSAAPLVSCDFDQPYSTSLSSDDSQAQLIQQSDTALIATAQTAAQTNKSTKFWTVVF